jgi:molecular chaperone GrpE
MTTHATDPRRAALLERFSAWLDEALADEAEPGPAAEALLADATDDERACDQFALWSAMTTLGQEVKVQGRTFHALEQAIAGLPAAVDALRAANERVLAERRRADEERAFESSLDLLLDVRERLRHGLCAARAHVQAVAAVPAPGRLARWLGAASAPPPSGDVERAFVRGYELALGRLDDDLRARGVEEIECVGRPFDPHRMRAIELAASSQPDGAVLEVLRGGYTRRGEVLRAAEVKVVRNVERRDG